MESTSNDNEYVLGKFREDKPATPGHTKELYRAYDKCTVDTPFKPKEGINSFLDLFR